MPSRLPASRSRRRGLAAILLLGLLFALSCSSLSYYGQAVWGQTRILVQRRSIAKLVDDPATPEALREKLRLLARMRQFAVDELRLPDNGSYRSYVELEPLDDGGGRRYVVWNVTAAPELSTEPLVWCFPVAGCVSYRGYFSPQRARRFAARLDRKGYDVAVSGAAAYSTLGWFRDPVLSTVIDYPEADLAALLFHELAHQLVYVKGDTPFNESFATAVEIEGVRRWLAAVGRDAAALDAYLAGKRREEEFAAFVLACRDRLAATYGGAQSAEQKRRRKRELFDDLQRRYRDLRESWGGAGDYDPWFDRELNNADLVLVGAYHDLVPAFERLLERHKGHLLGFYDEVRELAAAGPEERERLLTLLSLPSPP